MTCTCSIEHDATMRFFVRHCPLHAAAEELLDVLKRFVRAAEQSKWSAIYYAMNDGRAAIAKAETKP